MTKKKLIDLLSPYPDDLSVTIWCGHDCRDPGGTYNPIKVSYRECDGFIIIEMDDD